jgi:hypothetical protein
MLDEKNREVLYKINSLTDGAFSDFLVKHNLCPECLGPLDVRDNELVCMQCGVVLNRYNLSNMVVFGHENTPVNNLAFGKGQGDTLQLKGLWCVLAKSSKASFKCPKCGAELNDLPLRAQQISIITSKWEHPKILSLLRFGRSRCEEWGFGDKKSSKGILFSNYFGRILRKVGAYLIIANVRFSMCKIADACFVLCIRDLVGEQKYREAVQKLNVDSELLREMEAVYEVVK